MTAQEQAEPLADPRWDRTRVLFEIDADGEHVPCAISREALQDISDRRYAKPQELLACFLKMRVPLERVALAKYRARPEIGDGLVLLWSGDLDDLTPADTK